MAEEFTPIETAEAFEAAISERLEAARQEERGKYADYEDIKTQLAAANEANTNHAAEIAQLKTTNLKQRIAAETGFPLAFADQLAGDDEDAIRKNACGLLKATQPKYQPTMPRKDPDAKPADSDPLRRLLAGLKND